jgi:ubiquinol-cytochrome c reductase cytochrome b subunit
VSRVGEDALGRAGSWLDDRFHAASGVRGLLRKVFPDHWSFLLGEIALYSFVILLLSGTFLTLWFQPSMTQVTYHGSYLPLRGLRMSEAYASTLNISFDVRGGLLIRQIHHWAADLFMAAILAHLLRHFFTGAYRKPRDVNWLIGLTIYALALLEGLFGYSLPDDLLSGTGLRILEGVLLSIPLIGTYLTFFLFGGQYPGHVIIPRLYILHVLVIPALLVALVTAHLLLTFWQKHTQMPGLRRTEQTVTGQPFYPYFMAKTGAYFLFTFAAVTLAATFIQINPIWLYGPYNPVAVSAGSQGDFYLGFMEGALRLWPNWAWHPFGHTFAFNVFLPAFVPLGLLLIGLAIWPAAERWITGDHAEHHLLDRPRDAPTRTAIGMAGVTFYGVLWAEGANDLIADHLDISLYLTTEIARVAIFAGPVLAYLVTKRICRGLQIHDLRLLEHGVETGIIVQLPSGGFAERTRPLSAEERARLGPGAAPGRAALTGNGHPREDPRTTAGTAGHRSSSAG